VSWSAELDATRWMRREGWNAGAWVGFPNTGPPVVASPASPSHLDAARAAGNASVGPVVIDAVDGWMFCEWLDGTRLTPLELRRPPVIDDLVSLLVQLHASGVSLPAASMTQSLRSYGADAASEVAEAGLDDCVRWALDALHRIDSAAAAVVPCHLDVAENVIAGDRGTRLIDYEFAAAATPDQELGQLIWEGELDRRGAHQLVDSYATRSGHQVAYWATWCLVSGVSWTVWAMSSERARMRRYARRSRERLRTHWAWDDGPACG
jgi:thiamine kinase-like enzyme